MIEFKVGDGGFGKHAIEQVIDYTVDLKNFHEGSHNIKLIPVLVVTNAISIEEQNSQIINHKTVAKSNQYDLAKTLNQYFDHNSESINIEYWGKSIYKQTPSIIEAAQALYKGHNVQEITRSDSGIVNLLLTVSSC